MKDDKIQKTPAFNLSRYATVFKAEIYAIRMTIPFLRETVEVGTTINIMSDSQAAIKALANIDTGSKMVLKTKEA